MKIHKRVIDKLRTACQRVTPFNEELKHLAWAKPPDQSEAEATGILMTRDGRLALKAILHSEAQQKWGAAGLTPSEAGALLIRMMNLDALEDAALDHQRNAMVLRALLSKLYKEAMGGQIAPQTKIQVSSALHLTQHLEKDQ